MVRNWKNGVNRFNRPGEALYCVEHEGRIVGICGRAIDPADPSVLQLRHAYVLPEWRQLGIGSALLQRLLDVPQGMFRKITLKAYFPLVRKYCERRGFTPVEGQRHTHEMSLVNGPDA
jgi:N-acetylglutamate synthase-like GNAT family acetyltransferase